MARLLHTTANACCASIRVAVGLEQAVCSASCLACQHRFTREEDVKDMVAPPPPTCECLLGCIRAKGCLERKWLHSTRLETRTKESNLYASLWVYKAFVHNESECWDFAPATGLSIERGLSTIIFARTRKMVNYACEGQAQGKL